MATTTLENPAPPAAAPTAAPTTGRHSAKHAPRKQRPAAWKIILGLVVAVALLSWLGLKGWHAYRYVETDDAYVTRHIHQISPQLEARVESVLVEDNQVVKAGDVLVKLDPLQFQL